jgi:hypothetical protein
VSVQEPLSLRLKPEHVVHDADRSGVAAGHGLDHVVHLLVAPQDVAQHPARQLQGAHTTRQTSQLISSSSQQLRVALHRIDATRDARVCTVLQTGHSEARNTPHHQALLKPEYVRQQIHFAAPTARLKAALLAGRVVAYNVAAHGRHSRFVDRRPQL